MKKCKCRCHKAFAGQPGFKWCSSCMFTDHKPDEPAPDSAIEPESQSTTTLSGRSREDWHTHVDKLFDVAIPGEDIPFNALHAWTGKISKADIAWAKTHIPLPAASSAIEVAPQDTSDVCPKCNGGGIKDDQGYTTVCWYCSGKGRVNFRPSVAPGEAQRKAGIVVSCTVCGHRKKPRGRSAPVGLHMCDSECSGYDQAPLVGDLWPGETAKEFGYPCSDNGTTAAVPAEAQRGPAYPEYGSGSLLAAVPSEVAPSREQKLEDALREVLYLLSFHEGSGVPAGSGNSVIVVNEEDWNTALRVARAALEAK